jgi:hypothetical protein
MVLLVGSVGDSSLELTDGWYSILSRFSYGSALHSLVARGLIAQVTPVFLILNYQIYQARQYLEGVTTYHGHFLDFI